MREEKREGRRMGEERAREVLLLGLVRLVWGYAWTPRAYVVRRYEIDRACHRQRPRKGTCMTQVNTASVR